MGTLLFLVPGVLVPALYAWGLLPLSLAALLWVAGPTRWWERSLIGLLLALGLLLVVPRPLVPFDGAMGTFTVLAAAAFAGGAILAPGVALRQAVRATLWGVAGTGVLGLLVRGRVFWTEFHWSTVREITTWISLVVERKPELAAVSAVVIRFLADAFPAFLLLSSLAAMLLAWQWHVRISRRPLGLPLGPFTEFRFGDQWIWGLVLTLVVWTVPKLAALKWVAVNVGLVLGALYVARGAAVVAAVAAAIGVPAWLLTVGTALAGLLILPIFVLVPGLWTLGVFDTWLMFRQRRYSRSPVP